MSMRRVVLPAGFVALLAAAAVAGSVRWTLAPASIADDLNAALGPARLVSWTAPRKATFVAFPWPSLRLYEASLQDESGADRVVAPNTRIDLSLIDLALGRFAPTRIVLSAPTVTIDLDRPPFAGRFDVEEAIVAVGVLAPMASVSLTDGVVMAKSRRPERNAEFQNVQGRLDGLSLGARMSFDVSAVWRDAPITFTGSLDDPARAAEGRPSALSAAIASPELGDLKFDGTLTGGSTPSVAGDLSIASHAPAKALRLLGVRSPLILPDADIAIAGKVKAAPEDMVFDEATVTTSGETLQGALRLANRGGRLTASASLDADRLTLAPLVGPPERLISDDGGWSRKAFAVAPPKDFDLDLRLSVGRLDVYGVALDNVAASALLKDGALTANLIEATAYGGRGKAELRLACDGDAYRITTRGSLEGADVGAAASGFGWSKLTGKGGVEFAVETTGRSPAELASGLGGKALLKLADGALSGVNLEEALRRNQRRPLDLAKDMRSGDTAFEEAALDLVVDRGVAHVASGSLVAQGLRADAEGDADLGAQTLSLRVNAAQTEPTGAAPPDGARLSLDISGPWSKPIVQSADPDAGAGQSPKNP
jgi:AsmA protein